MFRYIVKKKEKKERGKMWKETNKRVSVSQIYEITLG